MADIQVPVLASEPQWLREARALWPLLSESERAKIMGAVTNGRPKRVDPAHRKGVKAYQMAKPKGRVIPYLVPNGSGVYVTATDKVA